MLCECLREHLSRWHRSKLLWWCGMFYWPAKYLEHVGSYDSSFQHISNNTQLRSPGGRQAHYNDEDLDSNHKHSDMRFGDLGSLHQISHNTHKVPSQTSVPTQIKFADPLAELNTGVPLSAQTNPAAAYFLST